MRFLLFVVSAFLFIVAFGSDNNTYEIKLKEKVKYLKRCVGRQGRLDHDENFDKFVIGVRKPLCLDLLRNSAQDYLTDEKPTEFNILISAHNNVTSSCKTNFTLNAESESVTILKVVCAK